MHRKIFYSYLSMFVLFLCLCSITLGQEIPPPKRYVEDRANIITEAVEGGLNGYLQELEQKTGAQMIVLTINTTEGIPIETYSIELATKWKLGQKGKDNGVLMVIAKDDRSYRIEVGYGLEEILPDSFCGSVGRSYFVSNFKKEQFSVGIFQAAVVMIHKIAEYNGVEITGMPSIKELRKRSAGTQNPLFSLLILLVGLPFLINFFFGRRRSSWFWWGGPPIIFGGPRGFGSSSSGGFGGFGSFGGGMGGSFGGGGASGRW